MKLIATRNETSLEHGKNDSSYRHIDDYIKTYKRETRQQMEQRDKNTKSSAPEA
jgi:hypothetical protein